MSKAPSFTKKIFNGVINHSPSIMTGLAVAGTISTAIFSAQATLKAQPIIENLDTADDEDPGFGHSPSRKEIVLAVWKLYIPTAISSAITIGCIIGANSVSSKRNAALASVYSISERALKEYQAKVIETVGESKAQKIHDDIAQDHIDNNPVSTTQVIVTPNGDMLCYDSLSGRYFKSNVEALRHAQNDINQKIINEVYASQNDFYRLIGLPEVGFGEELGWNTDNLMDLQFASKLSENNEPCLVVDYILNPIRGYYKFG